MSLLGYPFAEAKRQGPSVSGDFLGLVHDFSAILTAQRIQVWIRERLQAKIQDFNSYSYSFKPTSSRYRSKLYGCVTFLDQAVFGKIARAGLNALKDRQYLDHTSYLTTELRRCFSTISSVLSLEPRRIIFLNSSCHYRISGAIRCSTRLNYWFRRFPTQQPKFPMARSCCENYTSCGAAMEALRRLYCSVRTAHGLASSSHISR